MTLAQKTNLSIFLFIGFVILITIFVILPVFEEVKKNSQEVISEKEKLVSLESKIENLNKLKVVYEEFSPNLEKIDNLFVNPELPVEFITFLEKTAKSSEIEIKISPLSLRKKDIFPLINFQINATGFFPKFLSFLEKIENAPYLIEIQDLSINKSDKTEGVILANFSIKVYTR